ncbi:MAG: zinc-binding alcohol dehydrogenase family protein, partial [Candidatus Latescibacterota bacterium]|nr:zinc-binding alcohol dehydrogenase family protein [Candidatus Latescibacterota bacterium]
GGFVRTTCDDPGKPGPGRARIQIEKIGICGTDLHAYRGRQPFFEYPRILGHELGVVVMSVGPDVTNVSLGDRCAVEPYLNCGNCVACRAGKTNCCNSLQCLGVHTDGGMRESIIVPASKLHSSAKLETQQLALVETLGIGAHAVDRAQLTQGEKVLVIGAGPIGLSVIQFATVAGADVALLELNPDRMAFATEQFGIKTKLPRLGTALEEIVAWTNGDLPTAVFDATGNPGSMASAFGYVANGGRLTFVGLVQANITFNDPEFHRREMTLLASRNARSEDFTRIISMIESGNVDTQPWITHRAGYDDFVEAFPGWLEPEARVVKAMLELDSV